MNDVAAQSLLVASIDAQGVCISGAQRVRLAQKPVQTYLSTYCARSACSRRHFFVEKNYNALKVISGILHADTAFGLFRS